MILLIQGIDGFSRSLKLSFGDNTIKTPSLITWADSMSRNKEAYCKDWKVFYYGSQKVPIKVYNIDRTAQATVKVKTKDFGSFEKPYGIYVTLKQVRSKKFLESSAVKEASFLIFSDLYKIQSNARLLFEYMGFINNNVPVRKILLAVNIHPYAYPLLAYLGIDMFDTLSPNLLASQNIGLAYSGEFIKKELDLDKNELQRNNIKFAEHMVREIRLRIQNQTMYDFIKLSANWNPSLRSLLRFINLNTGFFAPKIAQAKEKTLLCSDMSDLQRVEVVRYAEKIKKSFSPFRDTKICLILPCSARKPYSYSRSHHFFRNSISEAVGKKSRMISELIVTSPLGIVPRELERIYPAAHYDISVTGQWYEEERLRIKSVLEKLVQKYDLETRFIAYLPEAEAEVVKTVLPNQRSEIISLKESTTAKSSLQQLKEAIIKYSDQISVKTPKYQDIVRHRYNMIVDFQFGQGAHEKILPQNWNLKKQQEQRYIVVEGKRFAKLNNKTGLLEFYLSAASKLVELGINRVYFDGNNFRGSSLFCAGVKKADKDILPGDEIVLINCEEEIIGIGEAILPGIAMNVYDKGMAAIIRKKRK